MERIEHTTLPVEVILLIARLLEPWDLVNLAIAIPGIDRLYKPKYWVSIRDREGNTMLHICAANQLDNFIVSLAEKKFDIHTTNHIGYTALHNACKAGRESSARFLLDAGLDPNVPAVGGTIALHLAVSRGELSTIRLLIKRRADISARTSGGYTALHWAVDSRNCDVAALLVSGGAEVDQQDNFGRTPLHWAAWQGNEATEGFERIVPCLGGVGGSGVVRLLRTIKYYFTHYVGISVGR
ncbi:ankyrin repeat-containing domain protein [Aspergillus insuetus]